MPRDAAADRFPTWLSALDARYLAVLTPSEVARALRALSSCYVERRRKLSSGEALGSAGKRAAFALFYAPLHFLIAREVVRALDASQIGTVLDLGCGTGAAGAAWAIEAGGVPIIGIDRHPWAIAEARWTYGMLGLRGRARQASLPLDTLRAGYGDGIIAAYTANELGDAARAKLLHQLLESSGKGARVLILEPIARRSAPWWSGWASAFESRGGRADEWRFPAELPGRQAALARAAGLDPRELTVRTLFLEKQE